ncbi:peroxiredoxin [Betaproteobacteria bacterium]|nr:peroxiredoxin [Betaproteobacteria bacterium]
MHNNTEQSANDIKTLPEMNIETIFGSGKLTDFVGNNLVIFFYPKDNTPGCTSQAILFSKYHKNFLQMNTQVVGVSRDTIRSHLNFTAKFQLSVNLISDENEKVCRAFGVLKNKNMYGKIVKGIERSTFFFNKNGQLVKEWRKVSAEANPSEVLDFVKNNSNQLA